MNFNRRTDAGNKKTVDAKSTCFHWPCHFEAWFI